MKEVANTTGSAEGTAAPRATERRFLCIGETWMGSDARASFAALTRLGHSVQIIDEYTFFPQWKRMWLRLVRRALLPSCVEELALSALCTVESFRPHCLFVFKGQYVAPKVIASCNARGIATVNYYPDVSFRTHGRYIPKALPLYQWVFNTKSFGVRDMEAQLGLKRVRLIEHGYDPELHRPITLTLDERAYYECDVAFIGAWSPKKETILIELQRRLPALRLKVWGPHWPREGALGCSVTGVTVTGEQYTKAICGARICLGLLSEIRTGASSGDLITARSFQIPACGVLMLHERTEEVASCFVEGAEIECFANGEELARKCTFYLNADDMRRKLAGNGLARARRDHRIDNRMGKVVGTVFANRA